MAKIVNPIPANIPTENNGKQLHDIDWYANGSSDYDYLGFVPVIDGNTLNGMFPKNGMPPYDSTKGGTEIGHNKKWLLINIEYKRSVQMVTEQWEYTNLPNYLDKYKIENILLSNAKGAWFKLKGTDKLYFQPFTVLEESIYGEPLKISIQSSSSNLDGKRLSEDKFVQMRDTLDDLSLFSKIIQPIEAMTNVLAALHTNLNASAPKGILIDEWQQDTDKSPLSALAKDIVKSNQTFFYLKMSKEDLDNVVERLNSTKNGEWYLPIELRDRTEELIKQYNFWTQKLEKILGLDTDAQLDKPERKVVGEVSVQQHAPRAIDTHRFNMRKLALERINAMFGTNWGIEWSDLNKDRMNPEKETEKVIDDE